MKLSMTEVATTTRTFLDGVAGLVRTSVADIALVFTTLTWVETSDLKCVISFSYKFFRQGSFTTDSSSKLIFFW